MEKKKLFHCDRGNFDKQNFVSIIINDCIFYTHEKKTVKYEKHVLGIVKVNGIVKFIENETNKCEIKMKLVE